MTGSLLGCRGVKGVTPPHPVGTGTEITPVIVQVPRLVGVVGGEGSSSKCWGEYHAEE